jgi:hypothetical protein
MYASLKKKGAFMPGDHFIVMTDVDTGKYLSTFGILKDVKYLIMSHPKSVYEMMKWKYQLPDLLPNLPDNVVFTYIDTDILALRPFQSYLPPDYLCVFAEGAANDPNYCGEGNECAIYDPPRKGYTAGFFQYKLGPKTRAFFKRVLEDMEAPKKYYTLDQPYFNKHLHTNDTKFVELSTNFICMNGHNTLQSATLLNCCGDPGDDAFHFSKQLQFWLSLF